MIFGRMEDWARIWEAGDFRSFHFITRWLLIFVSYSITAGWDWEDEIDTELDHLSSCVKLQNIKSYSFTSLSL